MKHTIICILLLFLFGCESPTSVQLKNGNYTGNLFLTQYVGTDSASTSKYQINFTFTDSGWYKYSNYFPSGGGTFQNKPDSIILTDLANHVAIGDWTLIFSGAFYKINRSDSLIMIQNDIRYHRYRYINLILSAQ
jgi:hypothetical protein